MDKNKKNKIPYPGLRNIKTAISILILLIIYQVLGRDNVIVATIASIICMQDSVDKSRNEGLTRAFGTSLGGIFGILFALFGLTSASFIVQDYWITFSIIAIIYFCNLIKRPDTIINSCIVFLLIVLKPDTITGAPVIYAFDRIIDTVAGTVVAILVNKFVFPPKPERVAYKRGILKNINSYFKVFKGESYKVSRWSGGRTSEIIISPKNSVYSDGKFNWRISKTTVENEQVDFDILNGYKRILMVIKGNAIISHQNFHSIKLEEFEQDFYDSSWKTHSIGKCTDFNLIFSEKIYGAMSLIRLNSNMDLSLKNDETSNKKGTSVFYMLQDNVTFFVKDDQVALVLEKLNKGDSIVFEDTQEFFEEKYYCQVCTNYESLEQNFDENMVLGIRVDIWE